MVTTTRKRKVATHTPEPWQALEWDEQPVVDGCVQVVADSRGCGILEALTFGKSPKAVANVKRAAECVNACQGMKDPGRDVAILRGRAERTKSLEKRLEELRKKLDDFANDIEAHADSARDEIVATAQALVEAVAI